MIVYLLCSNTWASNHKEWKDGVYTKHSGLLLSKVWSTRLGRKIHCFNNVSKMLIAVCEKSFFHISLGHWLGEHREPCDPSWIDVQEGRVNHCYTICKRLKNRNRIYFRTLFCSFCFLPFRDILQFPVRPVAFQKRTSGNLSLQSTGSVSVLKPSLYSSVMSKPKAFIQILFNFLEIKYESGWELQCSLLPNANVCKYLPIRTIVSLSSSHRAHQSHMTWFLHLLFN